MTLRMIVTPQGARLNLAIAMAVAAAAVWSTGMFNALWMEAVYGPMCGPQGHGLTAPHCPACLIAAALILGALVLAVGPLLGAVRATARVG